MDQRSDADGSHNEREVMRTSMRLTILSLLCVILISDPARAECVRLPLRNEHIRSDQIAVLFRGTVTDVETVTQNGVALEAQLATFAVDRVWKGDVAKVVTVFNALQLEGSTFQKGKRYLVRADPFGQESGARGLQGNAQTAFSTEPCSTGFFLDRQSPSGHAPRVGGR